MIQYEGGNVGMRLCVGDYNRCLALLQSKHSLPLLFITVNHLISIISKYNPGIDDPHRDTEWFRHSGRENFLAECQIISQIILSIEQENGGYGAFLARLGSENRERFIAAKQRLLREIPNSIRGIPDLRIAMPTPVPPPPPSPSSYPGIQVHVQTQDSRCTRCLRAMGCSIS